MILIVGLGNPGAKYARTRHNVGFDVVEILAARNHIELNRTRCKAKVGEGRIGDVRVALAQPQTYMNLSGEAVTQLVNWYKVEPQELLVVYDDVDLPFGRVRIRPKGSAGTHNGMRVGIGRPPEHWDMKDFVISGYDTPEDRKTAFQAYLFAAECVETFVKDGFARAQQFASTQPADFAHREEA